MSHRPRRLVVLFHRVLAEHYSNEKKDLKGFEIVDLQAGPVLCNNEKEKVIYLSVVQLRYFIDRHI